MQQQNNYMQQASYSPIPQQQIIQNVIQQYDHSTKYRVVQGQGQNRVIQGGVVSNNYQQLPNSQQRGVNIQGKIMLRNVETENMQHIMQNNPNMQQYNHDFTYMTNSDGNHFQVRKETNNKHFQQPPQQFQLQQQEKIEQQQQIQENSEFFQKQPSNNQHHYAQNNPQMLVPVQQMQQRIFPQKDQVKQYTQFDPNQPQNYSKKTATIQEAQSIKSENEKLNDTFQGGLNSSQGNGQSSFGQQSGLSLRNDMLEQKGEESRNQGEEKSNCNHKAPFHTSLVELFPIVEDGIQKDQLDDFITDLRSEKNSKQMGTVWTIRTGKKEGLWPNLLHFSCKINQSTLCSASFKLKKAQNGLYYIFKEEKNHSHERFTEKEIERKLKFVFIVKQSKQKIKEQKEKKKEKEQQILNEIKGKKNEQPKIQQQLQQQVQIKKEFEQNNKIQGSSDTFSKTQKQQQLQQQSSKQLQLQQDHQKPGSPINTQQKMENFQIQHQIQQQQRPQIQAQQQQQQQIQIYQQQQQLIHQPLNDQTKKVKTATIQIHNPQGYPSNNPYSNINTTNLFVNQNNQNYGVEEDSQGEDIFFPGNF